MQLEYELKYSFGAFPRLIYWIYTEAQSGTFMYCWMYLITIKYLTRLYHIPSIKLQQSYGFVAWQYWKTK